MPINTWLHEILKPDPSVSSKELFNALAPRWDDNKNTANHRQRKFHIERHIEEAQKTLGALEEGKLPDIQGSCVKEYGDDPVVTAAYEVLAHIQRAWFVGSEGDIIQYLSESQIYDLEEMQEALTRFLPDVDMTVPLFDPTA